MSNTRHTPQAAESFPATRRTVPLHFEEYAAPWKFLGRAECDGCGREDLSCWRRVDDPTPLVYCEVCARRDHAADVEREDMLFASFNGIVKCFIEAEVPMELIHNAALEAIENAERRREEFAKKA